MSKKVENYTLSMCWMVMHAIVAIGKLLIVYKETWFIAAVHIKL